MSSTILPQPQDNDAERAAIGAALINNEALRIVTESLRPEHFYLSENRELFRGIAKLAAAGKAVDIVTIHSECPSIDVNLIAQLGDYVGSVVHASAYAERVREKAHLRALITACQEITYEAYAAESPAQEIVDRAQLRIGGLIPDEGSAGLRDLADGVDPFLSRLKEQAERGCNDYRGLVTGFDGLDALTQGIGRSDLWFIGARPAFGKSSLAHDIIRRWSIERPHPDACCAIFSLEMSYEEVFSRIAHAHARIPASHQREAITLSDYARMERALRSDFDKGAVFIDSTTHKLETILSRSRRIAAKRKNLSLILIDHIGLVVAQSAKGRSRENEVASIAMAFKHLAMELSVPVLVCSQLSRSADARPLGKPTMGDLKDSGALEADADAVMLLWRPDKYGVQNAPLNGAVLILAKNRHGPVGEVQLHFNAQLSSYENPGGKW